ncbi:TetR/AcrR family transcriptional regulator [Sphingobium sp. SCG-1]|uniref:TetR/AcrR family transcriptional regulator n=1 Tax=Sphingobium sp. SCG-1 TaxID=2072936 RepID=UPI0016708E89|nr:TetR family transcriptional regulator [Sphingobium sp. SCG-1]
MRELNQLSTRRAIADAAIQLGMHNGGLESIRTTDIAEAAGVSPRTFNNYFANKYEAVTYRYVERMQFAADVLRDRPRDEPLWDAIRAAVREPWLRSAENADGPSPATMAELRLLFGHGAIQSQIMREALAENSEFARAVAERTGMEAGALYARSVAAAVAAVTETAIAIFLRSEAPGPFLPLITEALDLLASGFATPS